MGMAYSPNYYPMGSSGPGGAGSNGHMSLSTMYYPWNMNEIRAAFIDVMGLYPVHYEQSYSSRKLVFSFERGSGQRDREFYPQDVEQILHRYRKSEDEREYKRQRQQMEYTTGRATKSLHMGQLATAREVVDAHSRLSMKQLDAMMESSLKYVSPNLYPNLYIDPAKYYGAAVARMMTVFTCKSCKETGDEEHKLDHHGFCPKIAEQFWGKVRKLYWHRHGKEKALAT